MELQVIVGDITELKVDAIVNAANCSLLGGGGVDGAIHCRSGKELLEECRGFGGCKTGEAVITNGYNLPAKYVIHTPGPVWYGGCSSERGLLKNCYYNSLKRALEKKIKVIAFPAISTGVYRFPADFAAQIAINTVRDWKDIYPEKVIFCCFSNEMKNIYDSIINDN